MTGAGRRPAVAAVSAARVYDSTDPGAVRVLVDRLWPRGVRRVGAPFDEWEPSVAPSSALRTWYGHRADRFPEFAARYREELATPEALAALAALRSRAGDAPLVVLTATRDLEHSSAAVLRDVLAGRASRPSGARRTERERSVERPGGADGRT